MSDLNKLKVKRLTLAAEARLIKREETKALRWARGIELALNRPAGRKGVILPELLLARGYTVAQAARICKNARKAAAANWAADARERYLDLRKHRVGVVRWHGRVQHLAHAFIKGMPYKKVEAKTHDIGPVGWMNLRHAVAKEVETFGGPELKNMDRKLRGAMVDAWFEGRVLKTAEVETEAA